MKDIYIKKDTYLYETEYEYIKMKSEYTGLYNKLDTFLNLNYKIHDNDRIVDHEKMIKLIEDQNYINNDLKLTNNEMLIAVNMFKQLGDMTDNDFKVATKKLNEMYKDLLSKGMNITNIIISSFDILVENEPDIIIEEK